MKKIIGLVIIVSILLIFTTGCVGNNPQTQPLPNVPQSESVPVQTNEDSLDVDIPSVVVGPSPTEDKYVQYSIMITDSDTYTVVSTRTISDGIVEVTLKDVNGELTKRFARSDDEEFTTVGNVVTLEDDV
jgi:hypothetical protein